MFDWEAYLDVADHLVNAVGGEAAERSAISRVYYACYGTAWGYARAQRVPLTGKAIEHRLVWDWFREGAGREPIHLRVGTNGYRLKTWRIRADYSRSDLAGVSGLASQSLILARRVLADLAALP